LKITKAEIFASLLAASGVIFGTLPALAAESINVDRAVTMSNQGALLLDVREPNEYTEVHAPNAKLIPLGQLSERMHEINLDKEKPIVVICHSGRRSAMAAELLQKAGYRKVSNVNGGMLAWESSGLPVIKNR
jgi:rhodanese-related sulfurtransferase